MFGRLEPNRNSSKQPIDHGSSRTVDTALSPPQSPYPQPTGALHPATLAPLSASRSSSYSHQPPQLAPYRPLAPAYDPTRPNPPSSVGLHGLAEAAMMEEARDSAPLDRRLPPPLTQRPSNEDQGRFWEQRPPQPRPQSAWTIPLRPTPLPSPARTAPPPAPVTMPHQARPAQSQAPASSSSRPTPTPPPSRPTPTPAATRRPPTIYTSENPHPLANINLDAVYNPPTVEEWEEQALRVLRLPPIPPARLRIAAAARAAAKAEAEAAAGKASGTAASSTISPPLTAGPDAPRPSIPGRSIPAESRPADQSRQPPITQPTPPSSALPSSTIATPTLPSSTITPLPTSTSPHSTSSNGKPRHGRGHDRRPRATPHSSVWAASASQVAPFDAGGRRIHPPPGGATLPAPRSARSLSDVGLSDRESSPVEPKSSSDPGPAEPVEVEHTPAPKKKRPPPSLHLSPAGTASASLPRPDAAETFEAHSTRRRTSTRPDLVRAHSGSASSRSPSSAGSGHRPRRRPQPGPTADPLAGISSAAEYEVRTREEELERRCAELEEELQKTKKTLAFTSELNLEMQAQGVKDRKELTRVQEELAVWKKGAGTAEGMAEKGDGGERTAAVE